MEIKVIAEASTKLQRLFVGWGVSFLVNNDILFDTFSTPDTLKHNLSKQGVKISSFKHLVISHDHWDHTGGVRVVLYNNPGIKVYLCPGFSNEFRNIVTQYNCRIIDCRVFTEIRDNIYTTGEICGTYNGKTIFEQSLVIKNNDGLSVITGCAHPGIISILKRIKEYFDNYPVKLLLGGFHLHNKTATEILCTIDSLKNMGIKTVAPCHCTGKLACGLFKEKFRENFIGINTGSIINVNI